ncbi:MAG TPA: sigma-54 dependent transcriptional regulator [Vicinamibacterales bacterium]|jgi:transcriptional regulator with PAS, ATPase and Fis domain|nr:sigma-54 dependent transcriptional regulator [Vicinamibacterales bacterium]
MDDLTFSARRASAATGARTAEPADLDTRFRTLVQSPLRAGILRYLNSRPEESFDVEALMQTFGRLRLDVENCARELLDFGVVRANDSTPPQFTAERPADQGIADLLDHFLERRATVSTEDQSPSVQRFREMIGRDEKMLIVFEWIRTAAKSDISVLVLGPTGSGKELVARMIHELSRRSVSKFQAVNCAALPDTLFESEIFGYEKGAFTGAHDRKPGRLELANDGTLFLDEIGDMSLIAQAKLLRVLEERRFERLGGHKSISVDFRLISATNRPLEQFVRDGRFREDLYYRVNAFAIRLPSLRERQVDIPVLAQRFLARYCAAQGLPLESKTFSRESLDLLLSYHWPGNIRELESTVARAALSAPGRAIRAQDIEFLHANVATPAPSGDRLPSLAEAERAHIVRVLEAVDWNKKEAARVLDISRGTLYRKIVEFSLEPEPRVSVRKAREVAG